MILTNGHYAQKEENVTHLLDIFHVTTSGRWIAGRKKAAVSLTNYEGGISLICLRDLSRFRNLKLEAYAISALTKEAQMGGHLYSILSLANKKQWSCQHCISLIYKGNCTVRDYCKIIISDTRPVQIGECLIMVDIRNTFFK